MLKTERYDAVLLDMRLPGISGKEVLARLRRRNDNVPVLMLTAHGWVDDKVDCFGAGADEYVVKPFESRELVARIRALIRRQAGVATTQLVCGDLVYAFGTREFRCGDAVLALRRPCPFFRRFRPSFSARAASPAGRPPATPPKPLAARRTGDRGRSTHDRLASVLDLRRPTR